jgi:prepilin-type N-terminal cleavage/methylation domain-containing protein
MNARRKSARGFTLIELLARQPKPWRRQVRSGFTLIELLVVITIIGLLAAIIIPSIQAAMRSAKKSRVLTQMRDLDAAVKRYFTEYNRMPVLAGVNGGPDQLFEGADQAQVIRILINAEGIDANLNPKQIVFLDLDPAAFGVKTVTEMLAELTGGEPYKDIWGGDYRILMDLNFDDRIDALGGAPEIRAKAAVFSLGDPNRDSFTAADTPYKTW